MGIAGLGAGLEIYLDQSLDKVIAHEKFLADKLIAGLLVSPKSSCICPKICPGWFRGRCFQHQRIPARKTVGWTNIDRRLISKCAPDCNARRLPIKTLGTFPSGTVRLSPGYLNLAEEIELTVNAVEKIAASRNPEDKSGNIFICPAAQRRP